MILRKIAFNGVFTGGTNIDSSRQNIVRLRVMPRKIWVKMIRNKNSTIELLTMFL